MAPHTVDATITHKPSFVSVGLYCGGLLTSKESIYLAKATTAQQMVYISKEYILQKTERKKRRVWGKCNIKKKKNLKKKKSSVCFPCIERLRQIYRNEKNHWCIFVLDICLYVLAFCKCVHVCVRERETVKGKNQYMHESDKADSYIYNH